MADTDTDTPGEARPGAMSAEQGADFAAIQAAAAGSDVQPVEAGQVQEAQGPQPPSAQALGVAAMAMAAVRPLACHLVRGLATAPDELWEPVTEGVAGVIDHYGLARTELQGPWARLAISLVPLAGMVVIARMNEPEPEAKEVQQVIAPPDLTAKAPAQAAGSNVVTFGAPVA